MKNIEYIVKTGNWTLQVVLDDAENTKNNAIEAATRAIECMFGNAELNENNALLSLLYDDGTDYFDKNDDDEPPAPMFGVITGVFLPCDINNQDKWWYLLTSDLFANASQFENVGLAKEAEIEYKDAVDEFKAVEKELDSRLTKSIKTPKKNIKKKKK